MTLELKGAKISTGDRNSVLTSIEMVSETMKMSEFTRAEPRDILNLRAEGGVEIRWQRDVENEQVRDQRA